jgi:hypothetical protein
MGSADTLRYEAGNARWAALATACQPGAGIEEPAGLPGTGAAARLFRQVYDVSEAVRHGPPSRRCPHCRHPVTDLGPLGRPAHIELGHAAACPRLARDQAADDQVLPLPAVQARLRDPEQPGDLGHGTA